MKTIEAFSEMINTRGIHKQLNIPSGTINSLRTRLRQGSYISTDKMIELLTKAGYQIIQETIWSK